MNNLPSEEICSRYKSGEIQESIAFSYGVTRQRIQQILAKNGLRRKNGGAGLRPSKALDRKAAIEANFIKRYGLSKFAVKEIRKEYGYKPFRYFTGQKKNSKSRGIEFYLTFAEWWKVWMDSGKWDLRGVSGYCMTRPGDEGAYEIGNVVIKTASENHLEYLDRAFPKRSVGK